MFTRDPESFGPFGGHRGGPFGGGPGGFRAGRGMVEPAILNALGDKPMHGYEIISTLEEKSHGMWRPSAGSIYPTLQLLEEKGFIKSTETDGKKTYELTDEGIEENKSNTEAMNEKWSDRFAHMNEFKKSHEDIRRAMASMRNIMRKGTEQQNQALKDAIKDFRTTVETLEKEKK